jgi:hypothetical protein
MTPTPRVPRTDARPPRKTLAEQAAHYEEVQRRLKADAAQRRKSAGGGKRVADAR